MGFDMDGDSLFLLLFHCPGFITVVVRVSTGSIMFTHGRVCALVAESACLPLSAEHRIFPQRWTENALFTNFTDQTNQIQRRK